MLFAFLASVVTPAAVLTDARADDGRLVPVRGVRLYTEVIGHGPPVLFLHGGLDYFDDAFPHQKAYLSTFRTVIGVDQRGHGHSPDNEQPFSYRQMADDTAALLEQLGVGPVDVVGHSDGGNVALVLARFHPERVRRIIVSGANVRGDYNGWLDYLRFLLLPSGQFVASLPAAMRDQYVRVSPDGADHWAVVAAKSKDLWSARTVLDRSDLAQIRAPVLVMAGDRDVIPAEHTVEIFRGLPHAELCILPATGHGTMTERPEEFNKIVREFLERPEDP